MPQTTSGAERDRLITDVFPEGLGDGRSGGRLLRTREVAVLFRVSERTVTEWAARGRIPSVRTPGGHRRYPAAAIGELLAVPTVDDDPGHVAVTG